MQNKAKAEGKAVVVVGYYGPKTIFEARNIMDDKKAIIPFDVFICLNSNLFTEEEISIINGMTDTAYMREKARKEEERREKERKQKRKKI